MAHATPVLPASVGGAHWQVSQPSLSLSTPFGQLGAQPSPGQQVPGMSPPPLMRGLHERPTPHVHGLVVLPPQGPPFCETHDPPSIAPASGHARISQAHVPSRWRAHSGPAVDPSGHWTLGAAGAGPEHWQDPTSPAASSLPPSLLPDPLGRICPPPQPMPLALVTMSNAKSGAAERTGR
jgi:hypothetical protein